MVADSTVTVGGFKDWVSDNFKFGNGDDVDLKLINTNWYSLSLKKLSLWFCAFACFCNFSNP